MQFIYPVLDASNRTLRVRLEFRNRVDRNGPRLRPGMYGTVYLDLPATTGLMVPAEAVVDTGEMHYLFVAKDGGHFEPRLVKVGAHAKDHVEILSGVVGRRDGRDHRQFPDRLREPPARRDRGADLRRGRASGRPAAPASGCDADYDRTKFPDKYQACRACEVQHRGMGTMEEDCKKAIPKPWK